KVELINTTTNSTLSAISTTAGAVLTIKDALLSTTGNYTIVVKAAPTHPSSTGNYVLTLFDVASSVSALPNPTTSESFPVSWSGGDGEGEFAVVAYDVFVSVDGGTFTAWQTGTSQTSATYTGLFGHSYAF